MAPARRHMSFDWYESTTGDYIEPVEVEEKVAVKAEKETIEKVDEEAQADVTIYIAGKTTNQRFRHSWAIALYDGSTKGFRTYEVRKPFRHAPCTLKSSNGHPGETGVQYITLGKVSCDRGQELSDLCETIPVKQCNSAAYANRQYVNDVARFLVAGDFVSKRERGRAMAHFTNFINAERQQVEAEHQKDEREKARVQGQKVKIQGQKPTSERQSQSKASKDLSQRTASFPAWFLDGGNN
ncbi:hypothetical protein NCS57_00703700 [Fusarium keratoplasticum]|uniref:Uncharacterized protein n=1 Tax=Fusarium keratoplasticum TaxID=1328300 RepID=A0ACC0QWL7_9HYPO|nr:hypothetical protein NCS57_00703700 [Fusarium keratoplasticum]KAI8668905.1 hypothetical protein NCS57_00703700 [Fusarium keratoplasticum]